MTVTKKHQTMLLIRKSVLSFRKYISDRLRRDVLPPYFYVTSIFGSISDSLLERNECDVFGIIQSPSKLKFVGWKCFLRKCLPNVEFLYSLTLFGEKEEIWNNLRDWFLIKKNAKF